MLHLSIVHPQHIHDGILLSPKKGNETESAVVMTWMDLEPVVQSQKEKNEYRVFSHKHEESRKKRYRRPYLQGRKRDADIDNGKSGGKRLVG